MHKNEKNSLSLPREMKNELKRQLSAWLLLSVFIPMTIVMALHVHPSACVDELMSCDACVHHLPHGGHLTANANHLHDCIICHVMAVGFLPAVSFTLSFFVSQICVPYENRSSLVVLRSGNATGSRAPPVG